MKLFLKKLFSISFILFISAQAQERASLHYKLSIKNLIKCSKSPEECKKFFQQMKEEGNAVSQLGNRILNNVATKADYMQYLKSTRKDLAPEVIEAMATVSQQMPQLPTSCKIFTNTFEVTSPTTALSNTEIDATAPDFSTETMLGISMLIEYLTIKGGIPAFLDEESAKKLHEIFEKFKGITYELQHCNISITKAESTSNQPEAKK